MEIIGAEFRVLWVRRSWVGLSHLDSAEKLGARVVRANRLVEGEIVSLGAEGADGRREVVRSRIDPGYGPGPGYGLAEYSLSECEPEFAPYFALVEPLPESVVAGFYRRIPSFPVHRVPFQVRLCRDAIEQRPPFILPLHRLGEIEWLRGRHKKAFKYLKSAFQLGRAAIPPGFVGTLDWRNGANIPFFWVATDLIKALAHFGRDHEALGVLFDLSAMDRPGTWDADGLLIPLLLRAGHTTELGEILDSPTDLGVHEFVRALFHFRDGREADAVRALCSGMRTNPLMLTALLDREHGTLNVPFREGPYSRGSDAELFAALTAAAWRYERGYRFLERVMTVPHFRDAWQVASEVARDADLNPGGFLHGGQDSAAELFSDCFNDEVAEITVQILAESARSGSGRG